MPGSAFPNTDDVLCYNALEIVGLLLLLLLLLLPYSSVPGYVLTHNTQSSQSIKPPRASK